MISTLERIYATLLDRDYQKELFGSLAGFQRKGNSYIACCPFHEDTVPTLVIQNEKPEYFCFVCSQKGDWLEFLQHHYGLSFEDAFSRLAAASSLGTARYAETEWKAELERTLILEAAMSLFITHLWSEKGMDVLHYLYRRGYSMGEVEGMALGSFTDYSSTEEYLLACGFSRQSIQGVLSSLKEEQGPCLVIPYRGTAGRLMGLFRRAIGNEDDTAYRPITDSSLLEDLPFNLYRSRGCDEVIVVEGFFDALLLDQVRLKPVIAVGRKGLTRGMIETAELYGVQRFSLALGNGSRRIKATRDAISLLREKGLTATVLPIPRRYEDLDQYIRRTCLDHFKVLLRKNMSASEWMEKRKRK